jgi:hypothetical protein
MLNAFVFVEYPSKFRCDMRRSRRREEKEGVSERRNLASPKKVVVMRKMPASFLSNVETRGEITLNP